MKETNFEPILTPLKVIDSLFHSRGGTVPSEQIVVDALRAQTEGFVNIPWLIPETLHLAKNCQLVRMRGLIQDMPGTEPYAERYKVVTPQPEMSENTWCFGKYRDNIECKHDGVANKETAVVIDEQETNLNDRHVLIVTCGSPAQSDFMKKETNEYVQRLWDLIQERSEAMSTTQTDRKPNPIVVVKCYEDLPAKLNDVYDFVGILNLEVSPKSSDVTMAEQENFNFELPWYYREPIPTLHVISAEKVSKSRDILRPFVISDDAPFKFNEEIRNRLIDALSQALCGDKLAAEFLLCHLVSSIYGRSGAVVLGNFSINLCGVTPGADGSSDIVRAVSDLLHKIVAHVEVVRVSINDLNKPPSENSIDLLPKFQPAETRLQRGRLQLPRGSQIILDETVLETGKLDEQGMKVLTALEDIAQFQRMYYDFVYYQKEFDAEFNVVVFSDYKSLIKCAVTLPVQPTTASPKLPAYEPVDYYQMAVFLAGARDAVNDFELSAEMQEVIANDFATLRKEIGGAAFTADDLSNMIVMARWLTISHGLRELSAEVWSKAKTMEQERRARLNSFAKRQQTERSA